MVYLLGTLFKQIRDGGYSTKILLLFMTASCTKEMYEQLQLLKGLRLYDDNRNIFWPSSGILMKRSIFTRVMNYQTIDYFCISNGTEDTF